MSGEVWEWFRPLVVGLIGVMTPFLVVLLAANMLQRGASAAGSRDDLS